MKTSAEMPSALVQPEFPVTKDAKETEPEPVDTAEQARTMQEIDRAIARCRELYRDPLLSESTQRAYESMLSELRAEGAVTKVRENIGYLMDTLRKAEKHKNKFDSMLSEAIDRQWISKESKSKWWDRFNDPTVLEWNRSEWIDKEFPKIISNWKDVAEKRDDMIALAAKKGLTAKEIPELSKLEKSSFLSMHYLARKDQVARVKALILAYDKNKVPFIGFIQKELESWAKEGIMHASKVGEWMERVMDSSDPESFASKVLYPFKSNWQAVRQDFDRLNTAMDKEGIPRGFRPVKPDQFLLMNYKQRTSYMSLAWIRLENAEEADKKLAALKLRVRHNLDTKDYEGAQEDLDIALSECPTDRELLSMQTYLASQEEETEEDEAKEKESPDPAKLVDEMRQCLDTIPNPKVWNIYNKALSSGSGVFNRLTQVWGNRVWLHEVANWDEEEEQKQLAYLRATKQQGKGILLDMDTMGEEGVLSEISSHADTGGGKTPPNLSADEHWGYYASFIPPIPYNEHLSIAKNVNWRLKKNLRELNRLGYVFTSHGPLQSLN